MTDRIPLDHLTSDALDALYEQLEAAEDTEAQRQLATARDALASASLRAARMEHATKQAAELRARLEDAEDRARGAEATLNRIRTQAEGVAETAADGTTDYDIGSYEIACVILTALDEPTRGAAAPTEAEERAHQLAALAREILYTSHNISSHDWARWRETLDTITDQEQR